MAARTEAPKFGTFALDSTNGIVLTRFDPSLLSAVKWTDRLKGDGSNMTSEKTTGISVRLGGTVSGADSEASRDNLDALMQALTNGEQGLQFFSDRKLMCRLDRGSLSTSMIRGTQGTFYSWGCRMRSKWNFWEDSATVSSSDNFTGAGPHTLTHAANSASAPTWPTITITSNFSFSDATFRIDHTATLKQIEFIGLSMNSGEQIIIDTKEKRLGDGLNTPKTPVTYNPTYWPLTPGVANIIEISHSVGSSADWNVAISYEAAYWSM